MSTAIKQAPNAPSRPLAIALPVIAALLGVTSLISLVFASWRPTMDYSDFAQDYVAAKAWGHGSDPYANTPDLIRRYEPNTIQALPDKHRDPHTPFQILLARPFNEVPFRAAYAIWLLIGAFALVISIFLVLRSLSVSIPLSLCISAFALAVPTVRLALANGEPNAIALLLLVGAWLWLRKNDQSRAGVALGVATALRVFPILLVIPLIRKRAYRALWWQLASATVISAITGLILGVHATLRFVTSAAPGNFRYWRAAGHNLSLLAIPFRWLTPSHWFPQRVDMPVLAAILAVAVAVLCLITAAKTPARATGDIFWAALPWAILASPLAWADYLILLIPGIILLLGRATPRARAIMWIPVLAVLIGRPYFVHVVNPIDVLRQVLVLAIPLYGTLALALAEWNPANDSSG